MMSYLQPLSYFEKREKLIIRYLETGVRDQSEQQRVTCD